MIRIKTINCPLNTKFFHRKTSPKYSKMNILVDYDGLKNIRFT